MKIDERKLQVLVHNCLSDPSIVRKTVSGKRLQILSPGTINKFEGPDFLETAVLLDGLLIIGNAEFHRKSSEWNIHHHNSDVRYNSVILHIVFKDDLPNAVKNAEVLVLNPIEIEKINIELESEETEPDLNSIEELQHYALLRLLRKTSESQKLYNELGLKNALKVMIQDYLTKFSERRRRPYYNGEKLNVILDKSVDSKFYEFLDKIKKNIEFHIPDFLQEIIKDKISEEGPHLRREIILNCILPLAICLANESARIDLFMWYWSTPALHEYGKLKRKFVDLPQNFLWQQQGMLEYMKEHGRKQNVVSDVVKYYGFAEILSFYRLGTLEKSSE